MPKKAFASLLIIGTLLCSASAVSAGATRDRFRSPGDRRHYRVAKINSKATRGGKLLAGFSHPVLDAPDLLVPAPAAGTPPGKRRVVIATNYSASCLRTTNSFRVLYKVADLARPGMPDFNVTRGPTRRVVYHIPVQPLAVLMPIPRSPPAVLPSSAV